MEGGEVGGGEGEGGKERRGMCHWKGVKEVGEGREKQDGREVGVDGWLVGGEGREKEVAREIGLDNRLVGGDGREAIAAGWERSRGARGASLSVFSASSVRSRVLRTARGGRRRVGGSLV